jgi:hypothetical protein
MNPAVLAELNHLKAANQYGDLVAEDVVAFAANPNTALHLRFEWDDSVAGHKYRLVQARNIIRVVVELEPHTQRRIRTFVSLESTRQRSGGGYGDMHDVMSNDETQAELLDMALKDLNRVREKYACLTELAGVFAAIQAATAQVNAKAKRRKAAKKKSKKKGGGTRATP